MKPVGSFWRVARLLLLSVLLVFIAIQFIRPPLDSPPVTGDLQAPPEVKSVLVRACYDCHSNQTRLAWFDQPAPAYWMVVNDVREGRKVLNFSNWDSLPKGARAAKLFEAIFQVEQHAMPLSQYTLLHHGGVITTDEIAVLKRYVLTLGYHPVVDTAKQRALAEQWEQFSSWAAPTNTKDEYNGIGYGALAGFANWQAVSTTERYDNGTFRVIFGNDVVVKAIREGRTNPWPDGAVFAKAAWDQLPDSSGEIQAGAFKQVEFMIKDDHKYAATFGWGWARWVGGLAPRPYGKDASFVTECLNCHRPLEKTDHTFTFPLIDTLGLYDQAGLLPDSVGAHPLKGQVIASFVNTKAGTMSTLYGNELAVKSARSGLAYPAGAVVSLVTWSQRDDPHWFGGRIPQVLQSVEQIRFGAGGSPEYHTYGGPGLAKKEIAAEQVAQRVQYITAKRAAVLP
jgi:hypothetical protein